MIKAIDLSHHNGKVDFVRVMGAGINTAILRTGYGFYSERQTDKRFFENYENAKNAGLFVGAYHYSYATTPVDAQREAEAMVKIIGGRKFELPLFFDIEEGAQAKLSKAVCSDMVAAFCNYLEDHGYWAGVYSYDSFFKTNLNENIVNRYTTWVASVENRQPRACKRFDLWQYSWKGKVDGIKGDVDMNYVYKDFPQVIVQKGFNGY